MDAIGALVGRDVTFHPYPTPGPYRLDRMPVDSLARLRSVGFGALVFLDQGNAGDELDEVQHLLAAIDDSRLIAYCGDGTIARSEVGVGSFSDIEPPSPAAMLPVNRNPLMTKYIVSSGVLRDNPVTIVDVGARGGFNTEWRVFGDSLRVIGFEPDEAECARLAVSAPPNITYIPAALGKQEGEAILYVTTLDASSGLYRTDMEYFSRLVNGENGRVAKEHPVRITTLDAALSGIGAHRIDFIKLDAEGAELDILQGGRALIASHSLLGLLSEIRFQREINGCPTFADLDAWIQPYGFRLYGMHFTHQSRRALPYPGLADYRLPSGERFFAYTTHGQIMDGDALYFRDLLIPANAAIRGELAATQILKAAAFFEIYALNDCAAELILAHRHLLEPLLNCDELLDRLTPSLRNRRVGFHQYRDTYFDPNRGVFRG
jgi:FkbM family methyltransferase